ncbi:MAG TPA: aminopeptidase [Steroidobacteraceae bacterium]|nr:aminopeptidase [Steroidobacteraceae bacterium]
MLTESRIFIACLACLLLSGCGTPYLLQAAHGELKVLGERKPISTVVADPATPAGVRSSLQSVSSARDFASRVLGLPDNRSYRTYADIGRPYVVWNVVATPEFSVQPRQWCFPVAGCVAYRGYFKESKARAFAAQLAARGDDTLVDGVPAYSTLGRFADPVMSSMLVYGDAGLAGILFHELAHQLIYVRNDSAFNEAFATAVEEEGLRRWLIYQGQLDELTRFEAAQARDRRFTQLLLQGRAALTKLYATGLPSPQMRARKHELLASLAAQIRTLEQHENVRSGYERWLAQGLNNAHLASVATYYDCIPGFERLLAEDRGELARFYADVRALARRPQAERDAAVCARGGSGT